MLDYLSVGLLPVHSDAEIAAADSFGTEDTDYTTVQGLEYFTGLTFLMLDGAPSLTSLDLSANTKLTHVEVFDNALTELKLKPGVLLAAVVRGGKSFTPDGKTVLNSGDKAIVITAGNSILDLDDILAR